ncbi:MAG TPA: hypothetical protein VF646_00100 [Cytophagales bacterium]|jgi:hypothetical protein
MEKICRVLYKHGDLADWIAFEVYRRTGSPRNDCYEAYWTNPCNEVLLYQSDPRLDALRQKLAAGVAQLGYNFFCQEHQN